MPAFLCMWCCKLCRATALPSTPFHCVCCVPFKCFLPTQNKSTIIETLCRITKKKQRGARKCNEKPERKKQKQKGKAERDTQSQMVCPLYKPSHPQETTQETPSSVTHGPYTIKPFSPCLLANLRLEGFLLISLRCSVSPSFLGLQPAPPLPPRQRPPSSWSVSSTWPGEVRGYAGGQYLPKP